MSQCIYCVKDMELDETKSCSFRKIKIGNKVYDRDTEYHDVNERCHDCNIINGNYHHFGCDMERCPKCGDQIIGCECDIKELK